MPINRNHWKKRFSTLPTWSCPTCQNGTLSLGSSKISHLETGPSKEAKQHDAWEPEWITERFTAQLVCNDGTCGEIVTVVGDTAHEEDHDWERQQQNWSRLFEPLFINPAPHVFPIPVNCPETVTEELQRAFSLLWSDPGSSANRLRSAVEALLTDKKVPRTTIGRNSKRSRLSLHSRIVSFRTKDVAAADLLLAVKWLGNAGSHTNLEELERTDLLDGFELFEHVLELVYVRRAAALTRLAKQITTRKGKPAKKKRRRGVR